MDPLLPLPPIVYDDFFSGHVKPEEMDGLWAKGWRHFGEHFFRNSLHVEYGRWQLIIPLRVRLASFLPSKSQRRVWRKNSDLTCAVTPVRLTEDLQKMFHRHKARFDENVPTNLADFLGSHPEAGPADTWVLQCAWEGRTIAASFFDLGARSISSVYGIFDPDFSSRSLGIFTMLWEMDFAVRRKLDFYYPGYATVGASRYEYKKQFSGTESYDWMGDQWSPLPRVA